MDEAVESYFIALYMTDNEGNRFTEPLGFDPPVIVAIHSRSIDMTWSHPLTPNGIISQYQIYQNGELRETVGVYYGIRLFYITFFFI